ncbi:class I SAM-dependent rRNA methyltransferase [Flavilitoribacter nigricans]|uniref:RlmI/RlmK family 23S rRNA methyltransferase n=1 Tax=Flavilitoribacter nigricans (strain ATCC 23147 / DSM 23189 / NBRC 102662 / NCIMB 1420 / SS-2) TaxID=1122177 RepID=A0A2D0NLD9_FLAN2|nr:class I SAM-dependent rRNA methyltransferase [Flavilitoribacter nigricans]PHN08563.1 RlmI/RlmK family 23S rRNA methyltransferase [Flavilitoribacter nigricans DSM 23189 = NBRC 102662]
MKKIWLKRGKEAAVKRFHPWVFSGAVHRQEDGLEDGDVVEVLDSKENVLGIGHYQDGSITVRILSFTPANIDADFWRERIGQAYQYRQQLGLVDSELTNCYRLVHAAGDRLPGLIVDIYDKTAVIQCHSIGMHRQIDLIAAALQDIYAGKLVAIYDKSEHTLPSMYAAGITNENIFGEARETVVKEYGHSFLVNWESGQKTGFFLDQRENRHLISRYAEGKRVLNAFCYSGGFSVYALAAGAAWVDSVDISETAVQLTERNVALNVDETAQSRHRAIQADVLDFIKEQQDQYDIYILDPPAFAKSKHKRHKAVQAYKRLNAMAMRQMPSGGILFTFSCSKVVDKALFRNTIVAAAMESGRQVRVMHELGQPADHPVNFFHPEGEYLKGLVLQIV